MQRLPFDWTARYVVASLGAGCLLLALGCGSGSFGSTATGTPTGTGTGGGGGSSAKSPLHGAVAMGSSDFTDNPALTPDNSMEEPNADPNVFAAAVVNVTWKQLQPSNGSTLNTSAIEGGLSAIAAYNTAHPSHPMTAKLRVFAGLNAPAWAMTLDGAPPTYIDNGTPYAIPRFWTANYAAAWTALQTQLAAVYDKDPRLQEVAVSGCASHTAEPFIAPLDTVTLPLLEADGFNDTLYKACLSSMPAQYAAWTTTPLDYTFNQFTDTDSGSQVADPAFTLSVMQAWRTALGTRGVLANHGLQNPLTAAASRIYPEFTTLGGPVEFQTYGPTVNWDAAVALGLSYDATEIEFWNSTRAGGGGTFTYAQLQTYAAEL